MYLTKEELIILQGLKNNLTFAGINKNYLSQYELATQELIPFVKNTELLIG